MDYLSEKEKEQLAALRQTDAWAEDVFRQLDRLLDSRVFRRIHEEAKGFLGFVVAMKLLGRTDEIKETVIGIRVYQDKNFNPLESSKVRTAAAETLRKKISLYYSAEGQDDPIQINLPERGYVPEIRDRRLHIDVMLFHNLNPNHDQQFLCEAATDEFIRCLSQTSAVEAKRVVPSAFKQGAGGPYLIRGDLLCRRDGSIKINAYLQDLLAGQTVWDGSFEGPRDHFLKISQCAAECALAAARGRTVTASIPMRNSPMPASRQLRRLPILPDNRHVRSKPDVA
jgi:TolB-like protein